MFVTKQRHRHAVPLAGALLLVCLMAGNSHAGLRETFEAGNEAFWSGDYDRAIESWDQLVVLGVWDADVFYNLGTAHARRGRLGRAALNFERALLLEPGQAEALENLQVVRQSLARRRTEGGEDADLDPPRSFWMSLLAQVTPAQVTIPFALCWIGLFLILAIRRVTGREVARLALLIVALLLFGGSLVGGVLVASKASYDAEVREAIAVADGEAALREGPGARFSRAHRADEGDRLRLLDREGEWLHLRDAEGQEGWGRTTDFGELRQPLE